MNLQVDGLSGETQRRDLFVFVNMQTAFLCIISLYLRFQTAEILIVFRV